MYFETSCIYGNGSIETFSATVIDFYAIFPRRCDTRAVARSSVSIERSVFSDLALNHDAALHITAKNELLVVEIEMERRRSKPNSQSVLEEDPTGSREKKSAFNFLSVAILTAAPSSEHELSFA